MVSMTENQGTIATFRFLHTSDWQLGMPTKYLDQEARARFAEARLSAVERLFALAVERECEAIVVAGDVFDDNLLRPEVYRRAMDVLRRSPVPVFLLPGNHDPFDAASIYRKPEFAELAEGSGYGAAVEVLDDSTPRVVRDGEHGRVEIVGAPLLTKKPNEDLVAKAITECAQRNDERADIRVLVGHGNVSSFGDVFDLSQIDVAAAERACVEGIIDYVALGDTHSAMELGTEGTVWYSGAPEVTAFLEPNGGGENNSGKALVVDITASDGSKAADVQVEEVQVGQWAFIALEAEINSREDAEAFVEKLNGLPNKRTTVAKYVLRGTVDLDTAAWMDEQLADVSLGFARLYARERLMDLHVVPEMDELAEANFGEGFVDAAARELLERAHNEEQAASDALRLLYRLSSSVRKEGA